MITCITKCRCCNGSVDSRGPIAHCLNFMLCGPFISFFFLRLLWYYLNLDVRIVIQVNRKNIELEGTKVRLKLIERNVGGGSGSLEGGGDPAVAVVGGGERTRHPSKPVRSTPDLTAAELPDLTSTSKSTTKANNVHFQVTLKDICLGQKGNSKLNQKCFFATVSTISCKN